MIASLVLFVLALFAAMWATGMVRTRVTGA